MMHPLQREKIKMLSFLLQFPDEQMKADLYSVRDQIEAAFDAPDRDKISGLLRYLERTPLLELQESFSNTFDLHPATCLNLTYHQYGDDKARGRALTRYAQAYADAGFAIDHPELPDYLPMVLELTAEAVDRDSLWMLYDNQSVIAALAERLAATDSPYACILEITAQMFALPETETQQEA